MYAHALGMAQEVDIEIQRAVEEKLSEYAPEERVQVIEAIRAILDKALFEASVDIPDMACPACGCTECIRYGTTRKGTPRWQCRSCGKVRCHVETGTLMANTKLDRDVWMAYAECFVDHLSSYKVAKRIGVTKKTAWFMRIRTLEALFENLPSFEVKAGNGVQLDEMYFRESFKGTRFDTLENAPREPRRDSGGCSKGISNDKICVITGYNDTGDFFFDVACRGALTNDIARASLQGRIGAGAIVNTDLHRAYPRVMRELSAEHIAIDADRHENLSGIDHIHGDIRTFMAPFRGVSTKWLHLYLAWYKWLRCYGDSAASALRQMVRGDYTHTWRAIGERGSPFRDRMMNPTKC